MTAESAVSAARRVAWTASNPDLTARWAAEAAFSEGAITLLEYLVGIAETDGIETAFNALEDCIDELHLA